MFIVQLMLTTNVEVCVLLEVGLFSNETNCLESFLSNTKVLFDSHLTQVSVFACTLCYSFYLKVFGQSSREQS